MKVADLRLITMSHDKAQANLHAASGALVCLKRLQMAKRSGAASSGLELSRDRVAAANRAAALRSAGTADLDDDPNLAAPSSSVTDITADFAGLTPSGPFDQSGQLSTEMRSFVRGCFGPMLKAAMSHVLLQRPKEPFSFLADWFWQVRPPARLFP